VLAHNTKIRKGTILKIALMDPPLFNQQLTNHTDETFGMRNMTMAYVQGLSPLVRTKGELIVIGKFTQNMPYNNSVTYLNIPVKRWQVRNVLFIVSFYVYMAKRVELLNHRSSTRMIIFTCRLRSRKSSRNPFPDYPR